MSGTLTRMTGGVADITPKLFIFPHAGGTPQFYVPFAKSFTTDIKRTAVQYPRQGGKQDFGSFTSLPAVAAHHTYRNETDAVWNSQLRRPFVSCRNGRPHSKDLDQEDRHGGNWL